MSAKTNSMHQELKSGEAAALTQALADERAIPREGYVANARALSWRQPTTLLVTGRRLGSVPVRNAQNAIVQLDEPALPFRQG